VTHCLAARRHAAAPELAAQIRRAETAAEAAALAATAGEQQQDEATRVAECRAATLAKCEQNKHVSARLLATGSAPIIVVGDDPFWEEAAPEAAAGSGSGSGNALGRVLMDVRLELQEAAALEERRAGSVAHTLGAGLVALGLGIATAAGPPTDDEGVVIPADGDDTAVAPLQAEIEVARLTRVEEDWATGVLPKDSGTREDGGSGRRDELHQHLRPAEGGGAAADGDAPAAPAGWCSVIAEDFQWVDASGEVAEGQQEAGARLAARWGAHAPAPVPGARQQQKKEEEGEEEDGSSGLSWALRARNIKSRRFGLVCYELWEYYGARAMDAAERDDVALLDPSLFGGLGGDSSSDDDDDDVDVSSDGGETAAAEPAPEPVLQQAPVEWAEGRKVVTRVTAVLRIAPPGPAEDYGGVEWVHRHETKVASNSSSSTGSAHSEADDAREARRQQQQ
jgi:predicted NAD-dependent protein-ADP-ribosyltransferase YbiA (DUF1768 family)